MSEEAKSLLKKMANEFDRSKKNSFDSMFYNEYSNNVLKELYDNNCITIEDDVSGTIRLTNNGYNEAAG